LKLKNKLKIARVTHGDLTQQKLAEKVSCSRQTIISIETSKFVPSIELSLKIAQALKVPVEEIFYLEADENGEI
jgi:putative transcriptional regulator